MHTMSIRIFLVCIATACILFETRLSHGSEVAMDYLPFGVYTAAEGFDENALLFGYPLSDIYEDVLTELKRNYINTVVIENANRFLEKGLMDVVLDLSAESAIKVWASFEIPEHLSEAELQHLFTQKLLPFFHKSSLVAWSFRDEPRREEAEYLRKAVTVFRSMNGKQLVGFVYGGKGRAVEDLEGVSDFVAVDDYPIFAKRRNSASVSSTTARITQATGRPVWMVLQACSFRDFLVAPTPAELRQMTHMALANGAKGLFYFLYNYRPYWIRNEYEQSLVDVWLNAGPLWKEVGTMGKRLSAIGPLLLGASPVHPAARSIIVRDSSKIEWSVLRDPKSDIDFVIVYNRDTASPVKTEVTIQEGVLGKRQIFDLYEVIDTKKTKPLSFQFPVQLLPGDGKIMILCTDAQFRDITRKLMGTRFMIERSILKQEMRHMSLWGIDITEIQKMDKNAERTSKKNIFAAEELVESARIKLREAFNRDPSLKGIQDKLDRIRIMLADIDILLNNAVNTGNRHFVDAYRERVLVHGKRFFALKYVFQKGQCKIIDQVASCLSNLEELHGEMARAAQELSKG